MVTWTACKQLFMERLAIRVERLSISITDHLMQIMELLGPSLFDLRSNQTDPFSERMLSCIAMEAITILQKLHARGCVGFQSPSTADCAWHGVVWLPNMEQIAPALVHISCSGVSCMCSCMSQHCAAGYHKWRVVNCRFVHGDVKPENLVLSRAVDGQLPKLYLVDLGLGMPLLSLISPASKTELHVHRIHIGKLTTVTKLITGAATSIKSRSGAPVYNSQVDNFR